MASYIVSGSVSIYAHLFGILALPSQWLSLLLFHQNRKTTTHLTLCMVAIAMLGMPAFYFAISGDHGNVDWIPRTNIHSVRNLFFFYSGAAALEQGTSVSMVLLLGLYMLGILAAIELAPQSGKPAVGYLLLSIAVPIVLTIAVSLFKPLFQPRYLLLGLPPFVLLAAIGFQRMRPALAIATVLVVTILSFGEDYDYYVGPSVQDWRGEVTFIAARSQPEDELVIFPGFYSRTIIYYVSRLDHPERFPTMTFEASEGKVRDIVNKFFLASRRRTGAHRIWLTFPARASTASTQDQDVPLDTLRQPGVVDGPHFSGVRLLRFQPGASD